MPAPKRPAEPKLDEPVLAEESDGETVTIISPWGSKVTVSADLAHHFK